jgi:hypothetical protein
MVKMRNIVMEQNSEVISGKSPILGAYKVKVNLSLYSPLRPLGL